MLLFAFKKASETILNKSDKIPFAVIGMPIIKPYSYTPISVGISMV